jgi:hypothetical protein
VKGILHLFVQARHLCHERNHAVVSGFVGGVGEVDQAGANIRSAGGVSIPVVRWISSIYVQFMCNYAQWTILYHRDFLNYYLGFSVV